MKQLITLFLALLAAAPSCARADSLPLDTNALATLAVQEHGRKKPFTTFAQEMLLTLSGHSTLTIDNADGTRTTYTPEQVMLDLWFKPEGWDDRPVVMINFLELKKKLGLPEDRKLFSFNEVIKQPAFSNLLDQAQKLRQAGKGDTEPALLKEAEHLGERLRLFQDLVNGDKQDIVPNPKRMDGPWLPVQNLGGLDPSPWPKIATDENDYDPAAAGVAQVGALFKSWGAAYANDDLAQFNSLTPQFVESLRALAPEFYPPASSLQFEHTYMVVDPFLWAWIIYFAALLVLLLTAIWMSRPGYLVTWALVLAGLGFEVYGFVSRIIISGRPPVTDLYETVIWVSFIGMVFAVILEAVYRKRYFLYAGLPAAILTLIVADSDSTILDASINPLTAVLRNNMWLTIHVLTIVSSYAAFVLTAALAHIALVMSLWGRRYARAQNEVQFYIYRAMQIGILLLATGTILGGVWANYSWGRFWGWDPKETWALITLLCYPRCSTGASRAGGRASAWRSGLSSASSRS